MTEEQIAKLIAQVKLNTLETEFPMFTDDEIREMLEAHDYSVSFVSYKIAMLKSNEGNFTLGPIKVSGNADFWTNIANMYLRQYNDEKIDTTPGGRGGTIYQVRADEQWR